MALLILPYFVECYNSLLDVADANNGIDWRDAIKILLTDIGLFFLKHHVENMLGIILLHHRLFLARDKMLVDLGSVAVP